MPKARRLNLSTPAAAPKEREKRGMPKISPIVIAALIVIVVAITGIGFAATSGGPTSYACLSIAHQSGGLQITTSGLLHYLKGQYYISCTEGSSLPGSTYTTSCLTITPQIIPATIGVGASTDYYYISAAGHPITLVGAPAPTNGTEIVTPGNISLTVSC